MNLSTSACGAAEGNEGMCGVGKKATYTVLIRPRSLSLEYAIAVPLWIVSIDLVHSSAEGPPRLKKARFGREKTYWPEISATYYGT